MLIMLIMLINSNHAYAEGEEEERLCIQWPLLEEEEKEEEEEEEEEEKEKQAKEEGPSSKLPHTTSKNLRTCRISELIFADSYLKHL